MMHKHQEDDQVALVEDFTDHLPAGSVGAVFCQYTTAPPSYEINFVDTTGRSVGGIFYEDELQTVQKLQPLVQREAVSANS